MNFFLQKETGDFDIDVFLVKKSLDESVNKYAHTYKTVSLSDVPKITKEDLIKSTPVGTIEFVQAFLKHGHNIEHMNPIEVPQCLRSRDYLCRDYWIVPKSMIPQSGQFFVKDVSALKQINFTGDVKNLPELSGTLYQISTVLDIIAEYRIFVSDKSIVNIANYNCAYRNGNMINPDMPIIHRMIRDYSESEQAPDACTLDVAVDKSGNTCLLEVHPWACIGLYSNLWGTNLPNYYSQGYRYYLEKNFELKG